MKGDFLSSRPYPNGTSPTNVARNTVPTVPNQPAHSATLRWLNTHRNTGSPDSGTPAFAQRNKHSNPGKVRFVISRVRSKIVVGYAKRFYLSPGEVVREVRHVRRDMLVKAKYEADGGGSLGASGAAKLLVKAEAHLNVNLTVFGSWNKVTEVTVDRTVSNPTAKNRKFVAFRATHQYAGRFKRLYCQKHPIASHPEWIAFGSGSWRSHESLEEGTLRCGAGTPGSVASIVSARHCD